MGGRPFGRGNKIGKGRPPGSRNQRTVFAEMMDSHGEALIKQCQVLALKGDPTALRLCLERLLPPCKPSNNRFLLPAVETARHVGVAPPSVFQAASAGARDGARGGGTTGHPG